MKEIASVAMLITDKGNPGVKINASDDFMELAPVERVGLMMAAIKLCSAGITAIILDHPDDAEEIKELIQAVDIEPERALN